jgi:hypothetical protein
LQHRLEGWQVVEAIRVGRKQMQQSQQACGLLKQWSRAQQNDLRYGVRNGGERIKAALR